MSAEMIILLRRLETELCVFTGMTDLQRGATDLNEISRLNNIIANAAVDEFYACLNQLSVSSDCFCSLYAMLFSMAKPEWLFPEVNQILTGVHDYDGTANDVSVKNRVDVFCSVADKLCRYARVREFNEKKEEYFTAQDFDGIAERASLCLSALVYLMEKVDSMSKLCGNHANCFYKSLMKLMSSIRHKAIIVCLEHMSPHPWTNESSIAEANQLLKLICSVNNCSSFEEYLCSPNHAAFVKILSDLQPRLLASTWRLNPSAPHMFAYCLLHIRMPFLSDHLGSVLSTPLLLVDDHDVHYKCLGLDIIHHIVDNTSKTELRWYGRADVLYDLLKKELHSREVTILSRAIPCLLAVLDVLERSPLVSDCVRKESKYDEIFRVFIQNMLLETTIAFRRVYSRHLSTFIGKLGITVVRHMEQVLSVTSNYLEVFDGPEEQCRFDILEGLKTLIRQAWPRMTDYSNYIVQSLVKFIYDVATERTITPADVTCSLLDRAKECLKLLKEICPNKIEELLTTLRDLNMNDSVNECITEVLKLQS